jgi:O-succinylbenzoate synthase
LVRAIGAGGVDGWGECSALRRPTYTHEWAAGAFGVLRDELVPALLAGRARDVRTHPMAIAGLECAQVDLFLRREGLGLATWLGGERDVVPSCGVVGRFATVDELLAVVARRVDEGVVMVKLKIVPGWDVEPLAAVRAAWPDLVLAADANASFAEDPGAVVRHEPFGLAYLEQPLEPDDLVGSAALARSVGFPIALDESISSAAMAEAALALRACAIVNLKPARLGGIVEAAATAAVCTERGASAFVGGMLETGVGRAAALAVASSGAIELPTDLGPSSRYFADDLTEPFELVDGCLPVPAGPGIGVVPRPDRLAATVVERVTLRP